jgi:hypothetical protein
MLYSCATKKIHALKSEYQLRKYSSGSIVHYTFDVLDFYVVAHLAQTIYFWFYKKKIIHRPNSIIANMIEYNTSDTLDQEKNPKN